MLTKQQIINEIMFLKNDKSNNHISKLIKMRKNELQNMLENLQKNNDNSDTQSDSEHDQIKYEVSKLEQRNKSNQSKLVELTDSDSSSDDSEQEEIKNRHMAILNEEIKDSHVDILNEEIEEQEEKTPVNETKTDDDTDDDEDEGQVSAEVDAIIRDYENKKQLKKYKKEIKSMLQEFKDNIHTMLLEYNDYQNLSHNDVDDIWQYFDELHDVIVHNLKSIYREMSDDIDFDESFYKSIDKTFTDTKKKINKFIKD